MIENEIYIIYKNLNEQNIPNKQSQNKSMHDRKKKRIVTINVTYQAFRGQHLEQGENFVSSFSYGSREFLNELLHDLDSLSLEWFQNIQV